MSTASGGKNRKEVDIASVLETHTADIKAVEDNLRERFRGETPLVQAIGHHLIQSGGKRLRPLFLILSARLAGYGGPNAVPLAGIVEIIHTASLLHDDVVDAAELRRGNPSANAVWGNAAVVLAGDYLYSNALNYSLTFSDLRIIDALSSAITRMTEGELLQLQRSSDADITEEEYLRIILSKTGALFSEACGIGAILGGLPEDKEESLAAYGMNVGIAFQMVDDILDYMADEAELGKKLGKDLEEGKITLPLIYLLKEASVDEREEVKGIVEGDLTDEGLGRILSLIGRYGVIDASMRRAEQLVNEARERLKVFPDSPERASLLEIAECALYRSK